MTSRTQQQHYSSSSVIGRSKSERALPPNFEGGRLRMDPQLNTSAPDPTRVVECPYGVTMDLDFVKYAEDVASGQYKNHLRKMKKAKKQMRKSMELFMVNQMQNTSEPQLPGIPQTSVKNGRGSYYENAGQSSTGENGFSQQSQEGVMSPSLERSGALSPLESILSDSLENVMSDFEETTHNYQTRGKASRSLPLQQPPHEKDYSSDFEVSMGSRSRNRLLSAEGGYVSDHGYAIPQLKRQTGDGRAEPAMNSTLPLKSALKRPSYLGTAAGNGFNRPGHSDLSPSRRMMRMAQEERSYGSDNYAAPSDINHLSDSVTSLSSVGSATAPSPAPFGAPYRGLSGQIAANIENLAHALTPLEQSESSRVRSTSAESYSRRNASESNLPGYRRYRDHSAPQDPVRPRHEYPEPPPAPSDAKKTLEPVLGAIREQMALSLTHMRDLEGQVKNIPALNVRISSLKQDKERLAMELQDAKRELERERLELEAQERAKRHRELPSPRGPPPPVPPKQYRMGQRPQKQEFSPPDTPDVPQSSRAMNSLQKEKNYEPKVFTTAIARAMSNTSLNSSKLTFDSDREGSDHPSPPAPPIRSDSVDRMRREDTMSPAPPPPRPRRQKEEADVTQLPALMRTPSGNVMNMDAFNSLRRSGMTNYGVQQGRRVRDDDYVSDSEVAVGDSYLGAEKFTSLKRSRRILSQTGSRQWSNDSTVSDTEDYSISDSAKRRPRTLSNSSYGRSNSSINYPETRQQYIDEIRKWRQDFAAKTGVQGRSMYSADTSELESLLDEPLSLTVDKAKEFLKKRVFTRSSSTSTEPPKEKKSIGVGAAIEPEVKTAEVALEVRTGPCPKCEGKKKISIGIGTGPLPTPKPPKSCPDCPEYRSQLEEIKAKKPILFTKEVEAGNQDIRNNSKSVSTDVKPLSTIGITADIPEPKPKTVDSSQGTEKVVKYNIGTYTPQPKSLSRHVNTDAKVYKHAGTGIERDIQIKKMGMFQDVMVSTEKMHFYASIGVGTDEKLEGIPQEALLRSSETQATKHTVQSVAASKPSSVLVETKNQETSSKDLFDLEGMLKNLEEARRAAVDASPSRKSRNRTERGMMTEPEADKKKQTKNVQISTDKIHQKAAYVGTDRISTQERGVGSAPKVREAGTSTPIDYGQNSLSNSGMWTPESLSNVGSIELLRSESSTKVPKPEMKDDGIQVDLPPSEDEILEWVEEYNEQMDIPKSAPFGGSLPNNTKLSVGCGEHSVHGNVCDHCERLQYSFTRNVSVGTLSENPTSAALNNSAVSAGNIPQSTEQQISDNQNAPMEKSEAIPIPTSPNRPVEPDTPPATSSLNTSSSSTSSSSDSSGKKLSEAQIAPPEPEPDYSDSADEDEEEEEDYEEDEADEVPSSLRTSTEVKLPRVSVKRSSKEEKEKEESQEADSSPRIGRKIDMKKPRVTRAFELSRAAATKKMLTSENQSPQPFRRGTFISKSMRTESKKGDSLAYITDKKKATGSGSKIATPVARSPAKSSSGLKEKVSTRKDIRDRPSSSGTSSRLPPVTTSPKKDQPSSSPKSGSSSSISKQESDSSSSKARSTSPTKSVKNEEDLEAEEAADHLPPLPSEMLMTRSWPSRGGHMAASYENPVAVDDEEFYDAEEDDSRRPADGRLVGNVAPLPSGDGEDSDSSDHSSDTESIEEGSYDTNGNITARCDLADGETMAGRSSFQLTGPLKEACDLQNAHLTGESEVPEDKLTWSQQYLQHEWLKTAARKQANPHNVEAFIDALEGYSKPLLVKVVNMCDQNENTALHYGVSHGNFDVVSLLLDSKVCDLNRSNKAGYTPVMLAALCPILDDDTIKMVIQRLFQMGDVNIKASQHGQTALMLAVSHGKVETTQLLVEAGAGLNIQDEDGSTALMCAAEHGHRDIVKLLLAHPDIDASMADYDGSTALSIAVENGHRDIGVLIYAHLNYSSSSNTPALSPTGGSTTRAPGSSGSSALKGL